MARDIPESDWKLFRKYHPVALERFCQRLLTEVGRLTSDEGKSSHDRYLAVFELIKRRDREIAAAFNDLRRSTALRQLAAIQSHELLSEEELAGFTPETRKALESLLEIWGKPGDNG
jgi:hypothetical protein